MPKKLEISMTKLFKILNLETINICNRSCFFCKFGNRKFDEEKNTMSYDVIEKILKELVDLNYKGSIRLHHVNEPMLDKRIYDIIKIIKNYSKDIITEMTSNGDLINEASLKKLYESGLDMLNLSSYEDESMKKFLLLQEKWSFFIHDMRNGKQLYQKLTNQAGLIDLNHDLTNLKLKQVINNQCQLPFEQLVIGSNGEVALCCEDMYKMNNFGNVKKQTLSEIWFGEKFNFYRKKLKERKRKELDLCSNCTFNGKSKKYYTVRLTPI
jgi:radical SAM protein with 4Fe4S-binding SPASM domain